MIPCAYCGGQPTLLTTPSTYAYRCMNIGCKEHGTRKCLFKAQAERRWNQGQKMASRTIDKARSTVPALFALLKGQP